MSRPVPPILIPFLRREEGVSHTAYWDAQGKVWTNGVGSTKGVTRGTVWTDADVDAHLIEDLQIAVSRLSACLNEDRIEALNDNQYAALLSFVFNVGAAPHWGIWSVINNDGSPEQVGLQLMLFTHAGGEVIPGLVNRRKAECALYSGTDPLCSATPAQTAQI